MKKKKRKQKKGLLHSHFYRIYFVLVLLAVVGIWLGSNWLEGYLAEYESAQPVHAAQEVARLFEDRDFETLYTLDTSAADLGGGDRDYYLKSMADVTEGKDIAWDDSYASSEEEKQYTVTLDGDRFATFTLVPSGRTTEHGLTQWTMGTVTTHVVMEQPAEPEPDETETEEQAPAVQPKECRITVPEGSTVRVSGQTLPDTHIVEASITLVPENFLPEGVDNPRMDVYSFYSDTRSPEIEVEDASGAALEVYWRSDYNWSSGIKDDTGFAWQNRNSIYALAQKLAKYTSADVERRTIRSQCLKNSPAEFIVNNFDNKWALAHRSVRFENVEISECFFFSETCFTCKINFDYVLVTSAGDKVYPTSYTFCFVPSGGQAKLYNILVG